MKKHRGKKRYFKNLRAQNDYETINWLNPEDPKTWQMYWHFHFDYFGYGNQHFKDRKPHLDELFTCFESFIQKTKNVDITFHLYAVLLDFDRHSDALFLYTPQKDKGRFEFEISELTKESTLRNKHLNTYINNLIGYEKLYGQAGEAFCLIYKKGVGCLFTS